MSEIRKRALAFVARIAEEQRLFNRDGKPTEHVDSLFSDSDGKWAMVINGGHQCNGFSRRRGVTVRWFEGEAVCEHYSWAEVRTALNARQSAAGKN